VIKVAIIGCGKVADDHAAAIQMTPECQLTAVCDRDDLMARQLAERTRSSPFTDVQRMLEQARPQVCHITTPPQSHYQLGKQCLEAGCSVLIEKPFTVTSDETEELIQISKRTGAKLTAGHNHQFSHAACEMRDLIRRGALGGKPVHMESTFCYNMGDERYAKALLGDKQHWVRKLPGRLLHNIISHGVSKIAEYLPSDSPRVIAEGFPSAVLRQLNENDIVNELRVIIRDGDTTAYFTFSSSIGPGVHQFRVCGPKASLFVDHDHQVVIQSRESKFKSYTKQFFPPWGFARQYGRGGTRNIWKFMRNQFHVDTGRRRLMSQFYQAVEGTGPLPMSYREILCTARIMDDIFKQVYKPADN
jgi:predicted dehydrogenase